MTHPSKSSDPARLWLHPMLKVVRRSDAEIRRLLLKAAEAAASDVERLSPAQPLRRAQLGEAWKAIRGVFDQLFTDVGDTVRAGRTDAAQAAMLSFYEAEDPYYRAAGLTAGQRSILRRGTEEMSARRVEIMLRRFNTEQIPLSQQVYRTKALARGWVDNLINIGIGRGLSARELAAEVKQHIRPNVRGGTAYAAMRLARTEINNAFHTAAIVSSVDKPWVTSMRWHLSGSHVAEDICDLLAHEDRHGIGPGMFPKHEVPRKPHPHCFCYVTPELLDEDEFVAAFARGEYDDDLAAVTGVSAPPLPKPRPAPKRNTAALDATPVSLMNDKLDFEDRSWLTQYKGVGYDPTNTYLRRGAGEFLRENIEAMDKILDRSKLTDDVIVYRGIRNPGVVFGDRINGDLTGLEWIEDAYSSTSADKRIADGFANGGGLVMRSTVRKGAPMVKLSEFGKNADVTKEAELLGGRGWKMRITADHGLDENGNRLVDVEVIDHGRNGTDPWKR